MEICKKIDNMINEIIEKDKDKSIEWHILRLYIKANPQNINLLIFAKENDLVDKHPSFCAIFNDGLLILYSFQINNDEPIYCMAKQDVLYGEINKYAILENNQPKIKQLMTDVKNYLINSDYVNHLYENATYIMQKYRQDNNANIFNYIKSTGLLFNLLYLSGLLILKLYEKKRNSKIKNNLNHRGVA